MTSFFAGPTDQARDFVAERLGMSVAHLDDEGVRKLLTGLYPDGWEGWLADYQETSRRAELAVNGKSYPQSIFQQLRSLRDVVKDHRFRWHLGLYEEFLRIEVTDQRCVLIRRVSRVAEARQTDKVTYGTEVTIWVPVEGEWISDTHTIWESSPAYVRKFGRIKTPGEVADSLYQKLLS